MSKPILVVEDQEDNRQIIRDLLSATDYDHDHRGYFLCDQWRRAEGACGWL